MFPFLKLYPTVLNITLILIILLIIIKHKFLFSIFKKINKKTWLLLLLIFTAGLFIRIFLIPHTHYVYSDEFVHVNAAQNILHRNEFCVCYKGNNTQCEDCILGEAWPPGAPHLGAQIMRFFGDTKTTLFNLTATLGSLTIILFFLLTYLIYKNQHTALIGALLFSILPIHIKYSGSFALAIPAVFWILASMIFLEIFIQKKDFIIFCIFLLTTLYAVQTRTELIILPFIYLGYLILIIKKNKIKLKKLIKKKYILVTFSFLLLFTIPLQLVYYTTFIAQAKGWDEDTTTKLTHLKNNILPITSFYFNNTYNPIILTVLFTFGLIQLLKNNKIIFTYLIVFFLIFTLIYLLYEISNYTIFKDTLRYFLITYIPFILITANSFQQMLKLNKKKLATIIVIITLLSTISSLNFLKDPNTGNGDSYLDYKILKNFEELIPSQKYVITTQPLKIISTIQKKVMIPNDLTNMIMSDSMPFELYLYNSPDFDNFDYFYYLEQFYVFELIYYEPKLDEGCSEFCLYSLYRLTLKPLQSYLSNN